MSTEKRTEQRILHQSLRRNLTDLDLVQYGAEACAPGHSFGPAVRDHWLIHFLLDGKGRFAVGDREWNLSAGDGFVICPNQITWYGADWDSPWQYVWIGFTGTRASDLLAQAGLDKVHPIFHCESTGLRECLREMAAATGAGKELRLLGLLHLFLAELVEASMEKNPMSSGGNRREAYVKKAMDFFRMHYARPIGIADAAAHLGLDRSYFSEIFRLETGLPPRDFLIGLRMEKACQFMQNADLSIGDIARSVGYDDPLLFSKIFRRHRGFSPLQFRKGIHPSQRDNR